jgi:hypothetical protein
MENIKENAAKAIEKLNNKECGFYFFTLDTKGNPTGGIANIYEHVKVLNDLGYKAYILHENVDYVGVGEWLGKEYAELPHIAISAQNHEITRNDFIIIPEVFANVMESWAKLPAKKIVLSQSYDYIFELLNIGATWGQFGIQDVITTSEVQAKYIRSLFPNLRTHVVPVSIPEYFKNSDKPKKPIVSILTRDQKEAIKIVKSFYLQYPMYKWVTFRDLRGMPKKQFATALSESCLSIWVDEIAGFGTFPLESIECDTPVIGVIPKMIPEWLMGSNQEDGSLTIKNNGVWTNSTLNIPELIAQYLKVWLEDSVPVNILTSMEDTKGKYTTEIQKEKIELVYSQFIDNKKAEINAIIEQINTQNKE